MEGGLWNIILILGLALVVYKVAKSTLETVWKALSIGFFVFCAGIISAMMLNNVSYTTVIDALKEPVKISIDGLKALLGITREISPEESVMGARSIIDRIIDIIKSFVGWG